jgi:predicted DNA-binding transcriptional regulator AlpA
MRDVPPTDQADTIDAIAARVAERLRPVLTTPVPETFRGAGAAAFLGLSVSEFYRIVAAGDLPAAVRFAGSTRSRWRRKDLERALDRMKPAAPKAKRISDTAE